MADTGGAIDEAFTALVRRSLAGIEEGNAEEVEFLRRLNDPRSPDHPLLGSIVAFAARPRRRK